MRVNPTGSVEVLTGSISHGQGHETTFAQLVSDRLGIPIENVSIVHGDTDKVQFGMGTYGSRSGAVGMSAHRQGARQGRGQGQEGRRPSARSRRRRHRVQGRQVHRRRHRQVGGLGRRRAQRLHRAQILRPASSSPGLKEGAFYDPTNFTFPAGCHICEVEIDPETGNTEIVAWTAVDDFGIVINPMIVEGQVHGGIAQGVGQALCEGAVYDKDGQLVTGSFMDYCMPRADQPAVAQGRHDDDQMPVQSARHQGLRRGRRDRGAGGGDQRHHRRDRHRGHRHAGDAAGGVGGAAEDQASMPQAA